MIKKIHIRQEVNMYLLRIVRQSVYCNNNKPNQTFIENYRNLIQNKDNLHLQTKTKAIRKLKTVDCFEN